MGYYTDYTLSIYKGDKEIREILKEVENEFGGLDYAISLDGNSLKPAKWYDYEDDMIWLSEQYPDIVFLLEGDGEEAGDVWKAYFKNGMVQYCPAIATFEPYDPSKLRLKL